MINVLRMRARALAASAAVATLCSLGTTAQAQGRAGFRLGMNLDSDDALVGAQLVAPLTPQWSFYPSLDVYLPENGSLIGLNIDIKHVLTTAGGPRIFLGGGLNLLRASNGGASNTDTGADVFFGLEGRRSSVRPFGEVRLLLHDNTSLQLVGGLNFVLGR